MLSLPCMGLSRRRLAGHWKANTRSEGTRQRRRWTCRSQRLMGGVELPVRMCKERRKKERVAHVQHTHKEPR